MRYLAAPPAPGDRPDDFAWTMPGELLTLPPVCDSPGCACERAFLGTASLRGSSTGIVIDVPMEEDGIARIARETVARHTGLPPGAIEWAEAIEAVRAITGALVDRDLGDVVRVADLDLEEEVAGA
ncbi:hypothetical protein [Actinomadura sp. BRA 177]|uniref:DUF7715 family protein n=1 Tax=Actinomadura sp. BRA 177 TaxID=2745202 RepID=UPI0015957E03|nr:hypothetical protein [Actinomadura sp. BRA 177]NVI88242.1 hypothetical protein [Actinomadura sp. BRA 177]